MRMQVEHHAAVSGAPEEVWRLVADAGRRPAWMPELTWTSPPPGAVRAGDRFTGRCALLGHELLGVSEVVEAEPGVALAEEVVLGARFVSRWTFSEGQAPGTTTVAHFLDIDLPAGPFGRWERWLLRRRLERMQRQAGRALERALSDPGIG